MFVHSVVVLQLLHVHNVLELVWGKHCHCSIMLLWVWVYDTLFKSIIIIKLSIKGFTVPYNTTWSRLIFLIFCPSVTWGWEGGGGGLAGIFVFLNFAKISYNTTQVLQHSFVDSKFLHKPVHTDCVHLLTQDTYRLSSVTSPQLPEPRSETAVGQRTCKYNTLIGSWPGWSCHSEICISRNLL